MSLDLSFLLERVSPANRQKLINKIGRSLKQANQKRMTAQTSPDGQRWQARSKSSNGKGKMMKKLKSQLSIKNSGDELKLGFFGSGGRLANTHHFGLSEQLKSGFATYPVRELIGITDEDENTINELVEQMINGEL